MKEQIEEMAKVLRPLTLCYSCRSSLNNDGKRDGGCYTDYECCHNDDILRNCQALYNAGYRKQKEGEWIEKDGLLVCSECDATKPIAFSTVLKTTYCKCDYCNRCGAKMKGGAE